MSNNAVLNADKRELTNRGGVKQLRRDGGVPATIYGAKREAESLKLSEKQVLSVLRHAAGENILVDLTIDGGSTQNALIQEIQHHPVTQKVLHVDFLAVSANVAITSNVPVEAVGDCAGVKSGGILDQMSREIAVECLPKNLPGTIQVDISELEIGGSLHLKEMTLPEGVVALGDGDLVIFHVMAPRVESTTDEDEAAAPAATEPEALKEKSSDSEE